MGCITRSRFILILLLAVLLIVIVHSQQGRLKSHLEGERNQAEKFKDNN